MHFCRILRKSKPFVLQISVKQKRTFLQISVKTFIFCLADFCGTKSVGLLQISVEVHFWQISAESCGAGSGSHLDISPLSVCGFLLMCCFWPVKKKPVAVAGVRSPAVLAILAGAVPGLFVSAHAQYIESAAVRQAKADACYIIYYIYNIYCVFSKVRKSPMYQGFSAFLRCFPLPVFRGCLARFSGVARPKFGGVLPKIRGSIS